MSFSVLNSAQTGSGAHECVAGGFLTGDEADHSALSSAEVKMVELYLQPPHLIDSYFSEINSELEQDRRRNP
jgi:hypothetical protein